MRILVVGGGSGGHVTPVVAVVSELKKQVPRAEIRFWCDRAFERQAASTMHSHHPRIKVETISSGKYRRYYNIPLWRQMLRLRTIVIPNLIDTIKIAAGIVQGILKLWAWRPDVVFTKGGYVCLPVGFAAHLLRIPLVIHDSDAHPGLTNRVLSRWATHIATGAPLEYYKYPKSRSSYVGIPVMDGLKPFTLDEQKQAKKKLGFDETKPLVVVTGGGLGARRLNDATVAVLDQLLAFTSLLLVSGTGQYEELKAKTAHYDAYSFQLKAFVSDGFQEMLGAADVVVSRAGATTLLELSALAKPTVLVPNIHLTGGHQVKNAQVYAHRHAAIVLNEGEVEERPLMLVDTLSALLLNKHEQAELSVAIQALAMPNAAKDTADIILKAVRKH